MTLLAVRPVPPVGVRGSLTASALLLGLVGAVALRIGLGGPAGVRNPVAGLAFAVVLGGLCLCSRGLTGPPAVRGWWAGVAGAGVLCVVPLLAHLRQPVGALDLSGFGVWAVVVTTVAVAEEAFLRGTLWTALAAGPGGENAALAVSTAAFGLLHVPFYGLDALPLDLAVGLLLGGLRRLTGGWAAPAIAHTLADLAGWWLR